MMNRVSLRRSVLWSSLCLAVLVSGSSAVAQELAFVLEGTVRAVDGNPAAGAIVVSSAGGEAVTDENGEYRLELSAPVKSERVQITAVGGLGGKRVASSAVSLTNAPGPVSVAPIQLAQASTCTPSWLPTFGAAPGVDRRVHDMAVFDDGSGAALYVAGTFEVAGNVPVSVIAKWNGTNWISLDGAISGAFVGSGIHKLAVFDDGAGERLFAGGGFSTVGGVVANHVAAWDGSSWSTLGGGVTNLFSNATVRVLEVFDDGNGPMLYAGGRFTEAGGAPANNIAKWNGSSWSAVGSGVDTFVRALAVFDDGTGEHLFVGGDFTTAGGLPASRIAKWDGSNWTALGNGTNARVWDLTVFDDGTGERLIVGGEFTTAGAGAANYIAAWDGASWAQLGSGLNGLVYSLEVFDDGSGSKLVAGGLFTTAGAVSAGRVATWGGSGWAALGTGMSSSVRALLSFDDGSGAVLFAGGDFTAADGAAANRIAAWRGSGWESIGSGLNGLINALTVFDDGCGEALYAGGTFRTQGDAASVNVARWNGFEWAGLGGGTSTDAFGINWVYALTVFDDGSGPALFVGGEFERAGGVVVNSIAKWDGSSWSALGSGVDDVVYALTVFDDGGGAALYAGGDFENASGVIANSVAKWDGATWSALGTGTSFGTQSPPVHSMVVFDDGNGDQLYAGGTFHSAGGVSVSGIAKWDGVNWSELGNDNGTGNPVHVSALAVFDDGTGDALYRGNRLPTFGGQITKFGGSTWSVVGAGVEAGIGAGAGTAGVNSLLVYDDGSGPALYAGGFTMGISSASPGWVARWDSVTWSAVDGGMNGGVYALGVFDDGSGDALFAGGAFSNAFDSGDSYLARWACPGTTPISSGSDYCSGDGGNQLGCTNCPCSNEAPPGTVGGCLNSALSSARLLRSGDPGIGLPPNSEDDLRFALTGAPPSAFCILNSGDAIAPTNPVHPCFGIGSGLQALAFDGLRCAVLNTRRHGGRSADSNGEVGVTNSPWGGEGGPPVGIANAGAGFVAGQTRFFQVINRDDPLAQCMRGLNTSQAVCVTFAAGP